MLAGRSSGRQLALSGGDTRGNHSARREEQIVKTVLISLMRDDRGQNLIEYAVVAGLISIVSAVLGNVVRGL